MKTAQLLNYARDGWIAGQGQLAELPSAIDGSPVALTGSGGLDFSAMLRHARDVGGPALRKMTFHERARMLKALGQAIMARKEELYELSFATGATRKDGWIDIEGGAGTLFSFSSKARRDPARGSPGDRQTGLGDGLPDRSGVPDHDRIRASAARLGAAHRRPRR